MNDSHFQNFQNEYFHSFICEKFSQELQGLYKEDIGKLRAGFVHGIECAKLFYAKQIKNSQNTEF